jgi:hypothetical protein
MRPQYLNLWRQNSVVFVLMFLVGCSVPVTPASLPSATPLSATYAPTPITSLAPTPSSVLPPLTSTSVPTRTPLPPTPTHVPTLTADKEGELVLNLLQNNAGCRLPCWWGFTPGKTTWRTAQTFFASMGKVPAEYRDPDMLNYSVTFHIPQHDIQNDQIYIVRDDLIEAVGISARTMRNYETIYGDEQFAEDLQRYFLPQLLTAYGQPTEILLKIFPVPFVPFSLLLFYPQQGVLVRYYGPTERRGERIRVCPQQTDITLWLWAPEQEMTLEDIARWRLLQFSTEEVQGFRTLEKATNMKAKQFYTIFKSANNRTCLETHANMWP